MRLRPLRRNPRPAKDLPISIIASLVICTVIYLAVAAVLTGIVSYTKLDVVVAFALREIGYNFVAAVIVAAARLPATQRCSLC
ncbi:MAG: hypothetical protein R3C58_05665 [Parvularculaceae bacterium]